jgi:hypothetical protein
MSLTRVRFVRVPPGGEPGFDHADTYRPGRRMYVAHTGADRVDVLDCDGQTFLRALPDLPGVAGVLIDEEQDLLFTSDRGAARVSVFRCSDERLVGRVDVGPHPNGLAYDWRRRRLYAFNLGEPLGENCTASIVDLNTMRVIRQLALPGRPRWAVYDDERDLIYANIQPARIVIIDCDREAVAMRGRRWRSLQAGTRPRDPKTRLGGLSASLIHSHRLAGAGDVRRVTLLGEAALDQRGHLQLVFDDEGTHGLIVGESSAAS